MQVKRARQALDRWSSAIMVVAGSMGMLLLMVHSVANALSRRLLNYPIPGTTEYGGMWYLPVIAFVGFVIAQRQGKHIEVRLLFDRVSAPARKQVGIFGYLVTLTVLSVLTWSTSQEAIHNFEIGLTAGVTGVTVWPITFLPPICFAALVVLNLVELARVIIGEQSDHTDTAVYDEQR